MKSCAALLCGLLASQAFAADILFVGNSFTFGAGTPVMTYKPHSVTDLNGNGTGGVPALFKSFTVQAGLNYGVFLETHPGAGIDWHYAQARTKIGQRPWDMVLLQSYSTLDAGNPGNPAMLVQSVQRMAQYLKARNAAVDVRLVATWSRADQTYRPGGHWYGQPIDAMVRDVRAGYDQAAAATPIVRGVIPVGQAWDLAMRSGVADANPYDGIEQGKLNLWGDDHYHASVHGYYLEALTIFGSVTGRDPRSLGEQECAAADLGIAPAQARALQQVAFEQLRAEGVALAAPPAAAAKAGRAARCAAQ